MKYLVSIFLVFFFGAAKLAAQFEDVVTGFNLNSSDILFIDDYLYFTYDSTIAKVKITDQIAEVNEVITLKDIPHGMLQIGNFLYVSEYLGHRILKFDIDDPYLSLDTVAKDLLNYPFKMVVKDDTIYGNGASNPYDMYKFSHAEDIPVTPTYLEWPDTLRNIGMILLNSEMIVATGNNNLIVKFDTNLANIELDVVINQGLNYAHSLLLIGEELYVSSTRGNKILSFNIYDQNPTLKQKCEVNTPLSMAFKDNYLYVNSRDQKKIKRINLDLLEVRENKFVDIRIYPNPTSDYFRISSINPVETLNCEIYNSLGQRINEFECCPGNPVDIRNLNKGVYYLIIKNSKLSYKIIKN